MSNVLKALFTTALFVGCLAFPGAQVRATSETALKTVTLSVRNMDCAMCKITIRKALEKVDGVKEAQVDYETKTARVTFDPAKSTIDALTRATADAGYPSALKSE